MKKIEAETMGAGGLNALDALSQYFPAIKKKDINSGIKEYENINQLIGLVLAA